MLALAACRGRAGRPGAGSVDAAAVAAFAAANTQVGDPAPPRGKVISLVYTSNVGGEYQRCGCAVTPIGGLARRAAEVDRIRAESDGVVQVDAGDLFLPQEEEHDGKRPGLRPPARSEVERRARLMAAAYARLGVSAFTPGERDLALGVPLLRRVLADAQLPVVSANLVDARGALLFPADRIVEVAGLKVGIFGVLGNAPPGVKVRDATTAARNEARSLRARGARLVVALVHGDRDTTRALLSQTSGIDWAVLGHTAHKLDTPELVTTREGAGVRQLEAFELGRFLGRLDLHVVAEVTGAFADRDARARLAAVLSSHESQLAELEQRPSGERDPAFLTNLRRRAVEETRELRALPARVTGSWFENRVVALDTAVPDQIGVATLVAAYDAETEGLAARGQRVDVAPSVPGPSTPASRLAAVSDAKSPTATYLGTAACAKCHAPEVTSWRTTKHAHAVASLERTRAAKSLACVGCHVTGFQQPGGATDLAVLTTRLRDVGCEACHGPGSAHVETPREANLVARQPPVATCLGCHTPDRAPKGTFDSDALRSAVTGSGHGAR